MVRAILVAFWLFQAGAIQPAGSNMQADVDRLVQAAQQLKGTWPSQAPPPVREVALVARHGTRVTPLLFALLSDDSNVPRDDKRWKVQQQVTLALSQIYAEPPECGRIYCDGDPAERIGQIKTGWLRVIVADSETRMLSSKELVNRFKQETVFWRQFEFGQALAATGDRSVIGEIAPLLTRDDRHLRGNVAFVVGRLGDSRGFGTIAAILGDSGWELERGRADSCGSLLCRPPAWGLERPARCRPADFGTGRSRCVEHRAVVACRDRRQARCRAAHQRTRT